MQWRATALVGGVLALAISSACASSGATPRPFPVPPAAAGRPASPSPLPVPLPGPLDGFAIARTALSLRGVPYKLGGTDSGKNAFPTVTQSAFTINPGNVTYGLTITFDPVLFSNDQLDDSGKALTPELVVPKLTTTHASASSSAEQIFQEGGGQ